MSTANIRTMGAVDGTTARKLTSEPAPRREAPKPQRTPLAIVRTRPRRRSVLFASFCVSVLALALLGVLFLNIQVSQGQYQLVQLKAQQSTLLQQSQQLTQQVQDFQAPQNLALKAGQLGMVPATNQGQIDLRTLAISGEPKAATKSDTSKLAVVAPPAVAGSLTVVQPALIAPGGPSAGSNAASNTPATPAAGSTENKGTAPNTATPKPPAVQLNGGSVPAPAQRKPGN